MAKLSGSGRVCGRQSAQGTTVCRSLPLSPLADNRPKHRANYACIADVSLLRERLQLFLLSRENMSGRRS